MAPAMTSGVCPIACSIGWTSTTSGTSRPLDTALIGALPEGCSARSPRQGVGRQHSSRWPHSVGHLEHDIGGPGSRRLRSDLHDRIEPGKRLDLAPPLRRVSEQRQHRRCQIFSGASLLEEFRHHILAEHQIGEYDRRAASKFRVPPPCLHRTTPCKPPTIGTPASASSSVTVPDFASAARAMRNAACFSAVSTTIRGGSGHCFVAARIGSARCGTVGTTTSSGPTRSRSKATVSANTPSSRSTSPTRLPGSTSRTGGAASRRSASCCIRTQFADLSRQGMPDIGAGRAAEPPVDLGLERQQRQDVIDIGAHHPRAPRPPSPDRGRDIFDDRDRGIGGAYPPGDPPREAGTVDDDKNVRAFRHHSLGGKAHQAQDLWDATRNGAKSDDRKIVDRIKAGHPFGRHLTAADAGKAHMPDSPLPQRPHQRGAEPITRFLTGDEKHIDCFGADARAALTQSSRSHPVAHTDHEQSLAVGGAPVSSGSAMIVLPATTAIPAKPCPRRAFDRSRPDRRQVDTPILPALCRLDQYAVSRGRSYSSASAKLRDARKHAVGTFRCLDRQHAGVGHDYRLADVERTGRVEQSKRRRDVGMVARCWAARARAAPPASGCPARFRALQPAGSRAPRKLPRRP